MTMSHKSLTHMAHCMNPSCFIPKYRQPTIHAKQKWCKVIQNINTLELVCLDAAPSGNIDNLLLAHSMDTFPFHPKILTTYNSCKQNSCSVIQKYRHLRTGVSWCSAILKYGQLISGPIQKYRHLRTGVSWCSIPFQNIVNLQLMQTKFIQLMQCHLKLSTTYYWCIPWILPITSKK